MVGLIMGIFMAALGGPAMGWAVQQKGSLAAFEKRKAEFAAGKGKDPEAAPFGPHKTFKQNATAGAIGFGLIGLIVGNVVA